MGPSVHVWTRATPSAPVASGVSESTVPPPAVTANVTATPLTGFPLPSVTITAGGVGTAVPAGADCVSAALRAIRAAGPAIRSIALEVALLRPVAENRRVRAPTVPLMDRPACLGARALSRSYPHWRKQAKKRA